MFMSTSSKLDSERSEVCSHIDHCPEYGHNRWRPHERKKRGPALQSHGPIRLKDMQVASETAVVVQTIFRPTDFSSLLSFDSADFASLSESGKAGAQHSTDHQA